MSDIIVMDTTYSKGIYFSPQQGRFVQFPLEVVSSEPSLLGSLRLGYEK